MSEEKPRKKVYSGKGWKWVDETPEKPAPAKAKKESK